jgi:hypothetical protein
MSNNFLIIEAKRLEVQLLDRAIDYINKGEALRALPVLKGMRTNLLSSIDAREKALDTVYTPSTKHPAGTPIETIVDGLADRVVLCTPKGVVLETTADKVSALINVLTENGYCKPTAEYKVCDNRPHIWVVGAEVYAKSRS